ncbi:MAG: 16S rRNA (cytosine(1402)-N(4))-methyltransferase RsmH [Patescibacteria group bacterium]
MEHTPVLLKEVMNILEPKPGQFFIDGTLDGGGHATEIINAISPNGTFLGIDWDEEMIKRFKNKTEDKTGVILANDNFRNTPVILNNKNLPKADGMLLDLGFSSYHIQESGKGFSFQKDEPLDMKYNKEQELTAAHVVNSLPRETLAEIFKKYGEERNANKFAEAIVRERNKKQIKTTTDLVSAIESVASRGGYERGRIHPATRVFQALRIFVNEELQNVEEILERINEVLRPAGRVAVISFHSLEDRLVKNKFRDMAKEKRGILLTKKPIVPTREEILRNPRSRSAKLRALQII